MCRTGVGSKSIYIRNVSRGPEKEEPPHTVSHKLSNEYCPCLRKFETFPEWNFLVVEFIGAGLLLHCLVCIVIILFDIFEFCCIDAWVGCRLLIKEHPASHPDKAQSADDNECHLPTIADTYTLEVTCQRCRVGTVTFGEIFGCHFNGGREVSGLTYTKHDACCNKVIYAGDGNGRSDGSGGGNHFFRIVDT